MTPRKFPLHFPRIGKTGGTALVRARPALPDDMRLPEDDVGAHRNPASLDRTPDAPVVRDRALWCDGDFAALGACRRIAGERGLGGAIVDAELIDAAPTEASGVRTDR